MIPFEMWDNPKSRSESEYTLIYEFINDLIESNKDEDFDTLDGMIAASLEEMRDWCDHLLENRLDMSKLRSKLNEASASLSQAQGEIDEVFNMIEGR